MTIRTGPNAPLGVPPFGVIQTDRSTIPLGTIVEGYDDVNDRTNEYIWLKSPAAVAIGDDLTYDAAFAGTKVAAGAGQVDAIVASGANEYTWFMLKPRPATTP